jgi:Scaffold protein Nfu/NifU N terminal/HEAT repeats
VVVEGPGPELDAARRQVVERGLTVDAVGQLTPVVGGLSLEALATVKGLVKRFFSEAPWTEDDDDELADAVGAGEGRGSHELAPGLTLAWEWVDGRFRLRVERADHGTDPAPALDPGATGAIADSFDGDVVPEATPSPRTIRFATPRLGPGPSRAYESVVAAAADPRVARLFGEFDDVTSVLVGPDFVAVSIARPDRWESLLAPMLTAVTEAFASGDSPAGGEVPPGPTPPVTISLGAGSTAEPVRRSHLDRAWSELGALRADRAEHLDRLLAAVRDEEPARRQVAATLLGDAPEPVAARAWAALLDDPSRVVRRSVVDAVVDARREELRPLLERALGDTDGWTRWKALRGIADVGVDPSRAAVEACGHDPDFRVRLEAARVLALRGG